jgi:hypothetical protein
MINIVGGLAAASITVGEKQRSVKYLLHDTFGLNYKGKKMN